MEIRTGTLEDLEAVTAVEAACFPPAEAAGRDAFRDRLTVYGNHVWLLLEEGRLTALADGLVTSQPDLTDEMYADASLHDEEGAWQMLLGLGTRPERRGNGCAGLLLEHVIRAARSQWRRGVVLTCKDRLVGYYERFGFRDEGISCHSSHGNAVWRQMRLTF